MQTYKNQLDIIKQILAKISQSRNNMLLTFFICIGILTLFVTSYWYFIAANHVTTDNAYTDAEIAQVTASIEGTVKEVKVIDTQIVQQGDVLLIIDDIDAKLAVANANANVAKAKAEFQRTKINFQRRTGLIDSGSVAKEEFSNAEYAFLAAEASLAAAELTLEKANIDLGRTVIRAAIGGVIAKRDVDVGQKISTGSELMVIVPINEVYVNANFKEPQLRKIKLNDKVKLTSDLYGASVVFHGKVVGIAGGCGSVFSIIPAQNASGNWIKVVQRLAVRIALDPAELALHPLRAGLSMNVDVNVAETK